MRTKDSRHQTDLYRRLLRREAMAGGTVFGPVPVGRHREFFCLDEQTWFWHEEWQEPDGRVHAVTTRYDVRPRGVTKSQNGHTRPVTAEEALNFLQAARRYRQRIHNLYAKA